MSISLNHVTNDISTAGGVALTINGVQAGPAKATPAEMAAGTETNLRSMTPADVKTAIQSIGNQNLALLHATALSF